MNLPNNLMDQLAAGGAGIWIIGAMSVLVCAVALERGRRARPDRLVPPGLVDAVALLWAPDQAPALDARLAREANPLGRSLRFLARHRGRCTPEQLEARTAGFAARALRAEQQRAYPLAVVATMAPIVGLLGTVFGMIEAFHVIAATGSVGDASLLAGGISMALVNTAAGLCVALPALGLHHLFRHQLTASALRLEEQLERALEAALAPPAATVQEA